MTQDVSRWTPIGLVSFAMTMAIGCASAIDVRPSSADPQEAVTHSIVHNERVPLLLQGFRVTQNGAAQHPSAGIERRILNHVQETQLFSTLIPLGGDASSLGEKTVTARILFNETINPHSGEAAWKGFVVGASMFLLSPVIELNYDYAAQASLELERWDGQVKHYEAQSVGTAHYNLFGASPVVIDGLKGRVTEACLTDLMDQLIRDTNFYVAGSTALPDSPIRTVTVKGHKAGPSPLSAAPIPISLSPTP